MFGHQPNYPNGMQLKAHFLIPPMWGLERHVRVEQNEIKMNYVMQIHRQINLHKQNNKLINTN